MTKARVGVYLTPDNAAFIATHAHGRPTAFINAALDFYREHHSQQVTLDFYREHRSQPVPLAAALQQIAAAIRAQEQLPAAQEVS